MASLLMPQMTAMAKESASEVMRRFIIRGEVLSAVKQLDLNKKERS